jgi:transcriptional regulator of acetoin/glycerol metabolism
MTTPEFEGRLRTVRSHYRLTPWIVPRDDESPLLRSWQRSRDAGLREGDRVEFELVSRSLLAELEDRFGALVRTARPETERLAGALQGSGATVLMLSPRGTVIDRLCHAASTPDLLRTVTRVGINIAERCIGTTAPSIAITEGLPYLVGRDAHFCANLRPFFCVAAPIDSPAGERLAALDITTYDSVPAFDVLSLVVDAAAAIENSLFVPRADHLQVRFHPRADLLGTPLEGIVEVDPDGRVSGANRAATRLLWLPRERLLRRPVRELFDRDLGRALEILPAGRREGLATLRSHTGLEMQARFECASRPASPAPRSTATTSAGAGPGTAAPASLRDIERETIDRALAAHAGNVSAAARALRVSRNTIYRKRSAPAG